MTFLASITPVFNCIAGGMAHLDPAACRGLRDRLRKDIRDQAPRRAQLLPIDQDVFDTDVAIARALIAQLEQHNRQLRIRSARQRHRVAKRKSIHALYERQRKAIKGPPGRRPKLSEGGLG